MTDITITLNQAELLLLIEGLEQGITGIEQRRHELMTLENMRTDKGKDDVESLTNKISHLNALILKLYANKI